MYAEVPRIAERALIYARESFGVSDNAAGLIAQIAPCLQLCGRHDWTPVASVHDVAEDGSRQTARPRLPALARAVKHHRCTILVTSTLDRLARDPRALAGLVRRLGAGVRIVTVDRGHLTPLDTAIMSRTFLQGRIKGLSQC